MGVRLRVLHYNRDHSRWIGGDAVQVESTIYALRALGIHATYSCNPNEDLSSYDIVHIYHLTYPWGPAMALRCKGEGVPYVMSAIYYPAGGHVLMEIVNDSIRTIALSQNEKDEMVEALQCDPTKIVVIPNGVDHTVFIGPLAPGNTAVVNIGQIIETKGVLLLAQACKRLNLPLVQIGAFHNDDYGRLCMPLINQHAQGLPPAQVARLLQECKLYVCPSLGERQSLGVLEGAAVGLPVVDSVFNRGAGLLPSSVVVDPRDPEALDMAILQQYHMGQQTDKVPSWSDIAAQIKVIYG